MLSVGVKVLRNDSALLNIENSNILLMGVDDPDFQGYDHLKVELDEMLAGNEDYFSILLSHRPELFELYLEKNVDLVFS